MDWETSGSHLNYNSKQQIKKEIMISRDNVNLIVFLWYTTKFSKVCWQLRDNKQGEFIF